MIRDINEQVTKAVNEIEMRYSKGMKFTLHDLMASTSCSNESNYNYYINALQSKLNLGRIAQVHSTRNGVRIYIKL